MDSLSLSSPHDANWLRERFAEPRDWIPQTTGDGHLLRGGALRAAAVLVPIVDRAEGLSVLFTRRTAHLNDHAGQISFPGGRTEPSDATAADTALRETEEEIGLTRNQVRVLGTIRDYITVTGYQVTPVVGLVAPPFELKPDEFEVAEIFEVPLAFLLDPRNHQQNSVVQSGVTRRYFAIPYGPFYIWGATAGMLMNLYRFLSAV